MEHLTIPLFQLYYPSVDIVTLSNLRDSPRAGGIDVEKLQAQINAGNSLADGYIALYAGRVGVAFPFTQALSEVVARKVAAIVRLYLDSSAPSAETVRAAEQAIKWFEALAEAKVALTYEDGTLVAEGGAYSSRGAAYHETGVISRAYLTEHRVR